MASVTTPITKMLDIDWPIVGAPMFLVSTPALVAAVSESGGIGCLPSLNARTPDKLADLIQQIKETTTRPFGINIITHKEHNPHWESHFQLSLENKVPLVIISLGTPRKLIKQAHEQGVQIWGDATTLRHGQLLQKAGVDAVVAVAQGAGGHAGTSSPMALIPYFKENLSIPVLAAGSITHGRQMAAALALGADGIFVGTRLIATPESQASANYKQEILHAGIEDIIYTDSVSGIAANWIKSSIPKDNETQLDKKNWKDIYSAGHGVSLIHSIKPTSQVMSEIQKEYQQTIEYLTSLKPQQ